MSQAMNAALTQEGAQAMPVMSTIPEMEDPLDLGPTQPMHRIQASTRRESPGLSRIGDAKNANIKTVTTPDDLVPRQAMPACQGPKRKLEPDFSQAAKDMDLLVENSNTEQTCSSR